MNKQQYYYTMESLYLDTSSLVYLFFNDYEIPVDEKEDLVASFWLRVFEHQEKILIKDKEWLINYFRVMVKNMVYDYFNSKEKERQMFLELQISAGLQADEVKEILNELQDARREEIRCAVQCLTEEEKMLIEMRFFCEMSCKEVAKVLGIRENAVRARQFRIIKKLRDTIQNIREEERKHEK